MHKLLEKLYDQTNPWLWIAVIFAVLLALNLPAAAAPSCMSKQACIDSDKGYCRYTPTDNGRCWSTSRTFLKKVKAGKADHSERRHKPTKTKETSKRSEPMFSREPVSMGEPPFVRETSAPSEPNGKREPVSASEPLNGSEPSPLSEPATAREPMNRSEPDQTTEPIPQSEPSRVRETIVRSEPFPKSEPQQRSGPRPVAKSVPPQPREPNRSSLDITMLGVFTFATAFLGVMGARVLNEHHLYWGKPTVPPPPLDLANSPYRLVPGAAPDVLHLPAAPMLH